MKCPRNHEMVLLLRQYVCDICDVERRRAQLHNPTPADEGYITVPKPGTVAESGDHHWAWQQMQVGKAVIFTACSDSSHSPQACLGWGYRIRSGYVEHRSPYSTRWFQECLARGNVLLPQHTYTILS